MQITIVVPLFNEEESLPELCAWIDKVMQANNYTYEILLVDDGSKDNSWQVIEEISLQNKNIKGVKFRRNYGKSAALNVGFSKAQGDVVITMDADLQDSPDEIPDLYNMIVDENYDLVSGWKKKRYDPLSKTIPTKLYNGVNRLLSGIDLHDMNCGLKAYKYDVVKSIEIFGEMHRYIPVIAKAAGFDRIGEKVVQHQERKYGKTKFGLNRFVNGFLDMFTIMFITKFGKNPMHFFGVIGTLMFLIGFGLFTYLAVDRLFLFGKGALPDKGHFYIALTSMIIGVQLFLAGFIGELISRNSQERNNYQVEKEV